MVERLVKSRELRIRGRPHSRSHARAVPAPRVAPPARLARIDFVPISVPFRLLCDLARNRRAGRRCGFRPTILKLYQVASSSKCSLLLSLVTTDAMIA